MISLNQREDSLYAHAITRFLSTTITHPDSQRCQWRIVAQPVTPFIARLDRHEKSARAILFRIV